MTKFSRAKLAISSLAVIFASSTQAWEPTTHVYLAEIALNEAIANHAVTIYATDYVTGKILRDASGNRMAIGTFEVDRNILNAIQSNRKAYFAGVCGPDAFPDMLTGQEMIHPAGKVTPGQGRMRSSDSSLPDVNQDLNTSNSPSGPEGPGPDKWLQHLYRCAFSSTEGGDSSYVKPENQAFVMGYLAHAAGDTFAHTFINNYSGGPFNLKNNALKHVVLEKYLQWVTPALIEPNDFNSALLGDNLRFMYENMVRCDAESYMSGQNLLEGSSTSKSLSAPYRFSKLRDKLRGEINRFNGMGDIEKKAYEITHPWFISYMRHWVDDIDSGLKAWPQLSLDLSHSLLLRRRVGIDPETPFNAVDDSKSWDENKQKSEADNLIVNYTSNHLLSMTGLPDLAGTALGAVVDLYGDAKSITNKILHFLGLDEVIQWLGEVKDVINNIVFQSNFGMEWDEFKVYLHSPGTYFDRFENTDKYNTDGGQLSSLDTFKQQLNLVFVPHNDRPDLSHRRADATILPGDYAFDWEQFPAAFNSVQMIKLTLLSQKGMNDLYAALNASSPFKLTAPGQNAMLGWNSTLDGSNQWKVNTAKMPLAQSDAWYRLLFMKQPGEIPFLELSSVTTTFNTPTFEANFATFEMNLPKQVSSAIQVNVFAKALPGGDPNAALEVPLFATIPAYQSGTALEFIAPAVLKTTVFELSAMCGNYKAGATFTVDPCSLRVFGAMAVPKNSSGGGANISSGQASVTQVLLSLDALAPQGGVTINVSSNQPDIINFPSPTVTIPAGQCQAIVTMKTGPNFVGGSIVNLTAHYAGFKDVTLTAPFQYQTGVSTSTLGSVLLSTKVLTNRKTYAQSPMSNVLNRGTNASRAIVSTRSSNFIRQ